MGRPNNSSEGADQAQVYALGHSDQELERLAVQAHLSIRSPEDSVERSGSASGMRVLDVGSGAGDITFHSRGPLTLSLATASSSSSATPRKRAMQVRPGGVVVFHEPDLSSERSFPSVATCDCCCRWVAETLRLSGTDPCMGHQAACDVRRCGITCAVDALGIHHQWRCGQFGSRTFQGRSRSRTCSRNATLRGGDR